MTLSPGTQLGPYEIVAPLGAGAMGQVFRARDTRLGRAVAIKVLPESFASDPARRQRFEQESRAAGALNHPNVLAVHDVGLHEGRAFLVTELLEGQTLHDRLGAGPLPLRRAVDYAVQIAHGLAAAHESGIVHRDLKPANVFLTTEGRVKILDFGLAKQLKKSPQDDGTTDSFAAPSPETEPGTVLGTVGYMSPEQVLGRPLDHRTDLFSLGAILYEMLSGRRAFQRASAVESMTAILKDEPPELADVRPPVPASLEKLVRRCLEKAPLSRCQSARDLAFALESLVLSEPPRPGAAARSRERRLAAGAAGLLILAAAVGLAVRRIGRTAEAPGLASYRFLPLATAAGYEGGANWAPDGRTIAYVAESDGILQVFTRSLDSSLSAQITHSLADCQEPFWSADGTRIYYVSLAGSSLGLWSAGATGGTPQVLVRNVSAAALSPDGRTLALLREDNLQGSFSLSLWIASPPGAEPQRYPEPSLAARRFGKGFVRFAPDGKTLGLWASSTSGDTSGEQGYSNPELWLLPWPRGVPRRVLASLPSMPDPAPFAWMPDSRRIVFAAEFVERTPGTHLWMADTARETFRPITASSGNEEYPGVSPDGRRIAFTTEEEDYDLVEIPLEGGPIRPVLATARTEADPAWSPQGGQYAYVTDRTGHQEIWLRAANGDFERPIVTAASFRDPLTLLLSGLAFSPDGQRIAYQRRGSAGFRLWVSTLAGGPAIRLSTDEGYQDSPTWSPDGEWVAFTSLQRGRWALARARAGGGEAPVVIKENIVYPSNPRWSPGGEWITCELPEGFALVSPDGQRTRVLADETWLAHAWSKDGRTIHAVRVNEDLRMEVVAVDVASGAVRRLGAEIGPAPPSSMPLRGLSLAPHRPSLLSSVYRLRGDLWLLDGFEQPSR